MNSETSLIRERALKYCRGLGLDIGCGGDKIITDINEPGLYRTSTNVCLGFDMPMPYNLVGEDIIEMRGDARELPFNNGVLDYVYSSHLLEDFPDTVGVLAEWMRVIKKGGHMILYLPNEQLFKEHCDKTGQEYNFAHTIEEMSIDYILDIFDLYFDVKVIEAIEKHESYSFFVVVRKND
jgi:SAM-dependent methyltransferase